MESKSRPEMAGEWTRADAYAVLAIVAIAIASTLPFFYFAGGAMPIAHDLPVHWGRMLAFDEGLRSGLLYPRWLANLNYGYGAATTLFYAPGVYYALSAAHALTGDWVRAIEAVVVLSAAFSGVAFYVYARLLLSVRSAAVASALYLLLPYRLTDLYHRGALAELMSFIWMPVVLFALTRAATKPAMPSLLVGAIGVALLIVTHPPTAYLFAVSIALYAAVLALRLKTWRLLALTIAVFALGSALSAFYSIPAVAELSLVKQGVTSTFDARPGYISGLLSGDRFEQMIAAIAIATFVLIAALWIGIAGSSTESGSGASIVDQAFAWLCAASFGALLMLPIAGPLLRRAPGMSGTGFLWRWLAVQVVATSILGGIAFERLAKSRNRSMTKLAVSVLAAAVLGFGAIASAVASNLRLRFIPPAEAVEESFTPEAAGNIADLPRDAKVALDPLEAGDVARVVEWKPERRLIEVDTRGRSLLKIPTFAFPGWTATIDEREASFSGADELGAMQIEVPAGHHSIRLVFSDTPVRKFARWVSLSAILLCVLLPSLVWGRVLLSRGGAGAG